MESLPQKYGIRLNVFECGYLIGMIAKLEPADYRIMAKVHDQLVEIWKDTYEQPNKAMKLEKDVI